MTLSLGKVVTRLDPVEPVLSPEPVRATQSSRRAPLDDDSPMPFGKHKGKPMSDVPASYLLWMWDKDDGLWQDSGPLHDYIHTGFEALRQECAWHQVRHWPAKKVGTRVLSEADLTPECDWPVPPEGDPCDDSDIPF